MFGIIIPADELHHFSEGLYKTTNQHPQIDHFDGWDWNHPCGWLVQMKFVKAKIYGNMMFKYGG